MGKITQEEYDERMEKGRKKFVILLNRLNWKFCNDKNFILKQFFDGYYSFKFESNREHTEKFLNFLKKHEDKGCFPIYPQEISSFLKENNIPYTIEFKKGRDSKLKELKKYITYRRIVKQFDL